jgi:hypothetical protein
MWDLSVCKTPLFYNKLPNVMYLDKAVQKQTRGTKEMTSKDRVTIMVCANADGSHKLPLFMIGKSRNPPPL